MRPGWLLTYGLLSACVEHKNVGSRGSPTDVAAKPSVSAPSPSAVPAVASSAPVAPSTSAIAAEAQKPFVRDEWDVIAGRWEFEENGELTCECKTNGSLVFRRGARPKDFDLSVDVMFFGVESSAGIVFRELGEDFYNEATFYQFEWYTVGTHHDKRLSLMTKQYVFGASGRKGPFWIQIVEPKYPEAPYDRWIRYRVRVQGDRIETFIDGERVFDKRDPTFVREGRLGLHVFQPRKAKFRDFALTTL